MRPGQLGAEVGDRGEVGGQAVADGQGAQVARLDVGRVDRGAAGLVAEELAHQLGDLVAAGRVGGRLRGQGVGQRGGAGGDAGGLGGAAGHVQEPGLHRQHPAHAQPARGRGGVGVMPAEGQGLGQEPLLLGGTGGGPEGQGAVQVQAPLGHGAGPRPGRRGTRRPGRGTGPGRGGGSARPRRAGSCRPRRSGRTQWPRIRAASARDRWSPASPTSRAPAASRTPRPRPGRRGGTRRRRGCRRSAAGRGPSRAGAAPEGACAASRSYRARAERRACSPRAGSTSKPASPV